MTAKLGIDYDSLADLNPRLIYATINGFGSHGPKASEAGTEVIVEAETGLMSMMGTPEGPPVRFGVAMVDIATGMALVSGVLAAVARARRQRARAPARVPAVRDRVQLPGTVIASAGVDPANQGGRWGSGHPSIVPYAAFRAADGFIVIGAINELMWARLCDALRLRGAARRPPGGDQRGPGGKPRPR